MTTPHWMDHHPYHDAKPPPYETPDPAFVNPRTPQPGSHGGHGLMMLVCCIPMILLAVALVATGTAGSGAIIGALLCTALMAVMMLTMPGGHDNKVAATAAVVRART